MKNLNQIGDRNHTFINYYLKVNIAIMMFTINFKSLTVHQVTNNFTIILMDD